MAVTVAIFTSSRYIWISASELQLPEMVRFAALEVFPDTGFVIIGGMPAVTFIAHEGGLILFAAFWTFAVIEYSPSKTSGVVKVKLPLLSLVQVPAS